MRYVPEQHADAEAMAERIIAQLQHANSAVVLTTIKLLLYLMNYMENKRLIDYCCKKIGPPLGMCKNITLELIFSCSTSDFALLWSGSAICCPAEYTPYNSTSTCRPEKRCESFLLQIQRPHLREIGETGDHVSTSEGRECVGSTF